MRMIAEETKTGTIELLVTKPISEWQIIFGKYFAALLLVAIALLPTLIYYVSIYLLGAQKGNIDTGATIGSYIGLFLLSSTMVAVGIFTTSLTDNQVIAFLLAVFICFIMITGFDSLSTLPVFNKIAYTLTNLGINAHYQSLSRGVMDSRDVLYFLSVDALFLLLSKTMLDTRKW